MDKSNVWQGKATEAKRGKRPTFYTYPAVCLALGRKGEFAIL
jgi:hypothetical protein